MILVYSYLLDLSPSL